MVTKDFPYILVDGLNKKLDSGIQVGYLYSITVYNFSLIKTVARDLDKWKLKLIEIM
jgi:hypothetical protein